MLPVVAVAAAHRRATRPTTAPAHPVHHHQARAPHTRVPKSAAPPLFGGQRRFPERRSWQEPLRLAVLKMLFVEPLRLRLPVHNCLKAKITHVPFGLTATNTPDLGVPQPCTAEAPPHSRESAVVSNQVVHVQQGDARPHRWHFDRSQSPNRDTDRNTIISFTITPTLPKTTTATDRLELRLELIRARLLPSLSLFFPSHQKMFLLFLHYVPSCLPLVCVSFFDG